MDTQIQPEPPSRKREKWNKKKVALAILLAMGCSLLIHSASQFQQQSAAAAIRAKTKIGAFPVIEPTYRFGLMMDTLHLSESEIQPNEFLSDILMERGVAYPVIENLVQNAKEVFDVRNLRSGKPYFLLSSDTTTTPNYFVYEPSVYSYIIFDLNDYTVTKTERPIESRVETASGIIESSLWNTMVDNGLSYELTSKMEDALAWSIDFHHIQKEDRFKLVYERHYIDGNPVGVGEIRAAYFKNFDNEYYAFYFENDRHHGYYDLEARPMEKAFLKSPVKYSRISSGYNLRRFHPVLKRRRPHYGTDYAAPRGTPIYAVADGVVTKSSYTRGNGNYVKIKHDKVYQTQYLHMQRRGDGIKPGVHVKQGQTIGFVGSTGLATGPHVCFRFWKHGKQVNHLRENLPPPDPMPSEDIPLFNQIRDSLKLELDKVSFKLKKVAIEMIPDSTGVRRTNP